MSRIPRGQVSHTMSGHAPRLLPDAQPPSQPKTPEALSAFIPIPLPFDWNHLLETRLSPQELSRIRTAVNSQGPFGSPDWQTMIAKLLGLVSSLTPCGRPRKTPEK